MRRVAAIAITCVLVVLVPAFVRAQTPTSVSATASVSVPRVVTVSGIYQPASGLAAPARATITLSVYTD